MIIIFLFSFINYLFILLIRLNNKILFSRPLELQPQDKSIEETSGNWYSDPDEDRITDDVFRHNTYRPKSSNHNSVLECVNQILLRDMEEEENILSVSRKFKHRGRIVSFQPARLSDIESVGSEMERRNSEEVSGDKDTINFESIGGSEDEYGRINGSQGGETSSSTRSTRPASGSESGIDEEIETESTLARAIPIVIIEPEIDEEDDDDDDDDNIGPVSPGHSLKSSNSSSSLLRLESIEEKTCMSMSTKGLTLAKNLDYEDIESLPDMMPQPPRTPPALPPKPQFRNNTLILKKIPSPSFLIDETKNKNSPGREASSYARKFYQSITPIRPVSASVRSLFIRKRPTNNVDNGNLNDTKEKLNLDLLNKNVVESKSAGTGAALPPPRITNIVRHFEEFKIGGDTELRVKAKEIEEIDIRQNFEEFNLDDCDLSDDPDRLDGDGSDKLGNTIISNRLDNDSTTTTTAKNTTDNNNPNYNSENNNSSGIYDHFLEATGLSTKSILTPSRLISNHKSMLKPKDIKYKNKIKSNSMSERSNYTTTTTGNSQTHVRHWTGPFV